MAQHGFWPVTASLIRINGWYSGITQVYPLFTEPSEGRSYPEQSHSRSFYLVQLSTIQNLLVASWGSAHNYPLFSHPSEGRSYPDLWSIPGPFIWHNYQPVRIYGWHHGDQPISIRYSPIHLKVLPWPQEHSRSFSMAQLSQSLSLAQLSASQNLKVASWRSAHIYPLFTDLSEGSSYPDLGSILGPFLWHTNLPGRVYVWNHGSWRRSICYSVVCTCLYHYQWKHVQNLWLRGKNLDMAVLPEWIIFTRISWTAPGNNKKQKITL